MSLKDYAAIIIDDYGDNMLESSIKSALNNDDSDISKNL